MANGKVITGYSFPFVAKYNNNAGTITYSGGLELARGVDVDDSPETSDAVIFYANNVAAESSGSIFTTSEITLTVDGMKKEARKLVMGLPDYDVITINEKEYKVAKFNKNQKIPYVGLGFVVRYMSGGVTSYDAFVMRKVMFQQEPLSAATQEETIEFQTSELTATVMRDDSADLEWKYQVEDLETEEEAVAIIKYFLNIESI